MGVPKTDSALKTPEQLQAEAERYSAWREVVASRLSDAGRWAESANFRDCGKLFGNFQVLVCQNDVAHEARALPFTCHLRYCPDCERRWQAKLVAKYVPALKEAAENSDRDSWSLKKIELTTPYSLLADNAAELFRDAWGHLERWLQLTFQFLLRNELTPAEKKRGRVELGDHGVGVLASVEFGENGLKLHFHILALMPFLGKHKSSDLWLQASGGTSSITYMRRIDYHDVDDAVKEQVKYVTKFSQLRPDLVVKLADVMEGQRRLRTWGVFRGAKKLDPVPCTCKACSSALELIRVREYFERIIVRNVEPDPVLLAAASSIYLEFKHGNKDGVGGQHLARSDIPDLPSDTKLPFFDDVPIKKKPFVYY